MLMPEAKKRPEEKKKTDIEKVQNQIGVSLFVIPKIINSVNIQNMIQKFKQKT